MPFYKEDSILLKRYTLQNLLKEFPRNSWNLQSLETVEIDVHGATAKCREGDLVVQSGRYTTDTSVST